MTETKFEEEFPSLKGCAMEIEYIERYCLDKQRVIDAINLCTHDMGANGLVIDYDDLLTELGLDKNEFK